jgi:hypothetical protein
MTQWHPLFAEILRPWLEKYYEVQTNVPVGDVPREADIVLLRRISSSPPPFQGIWKELTTWNILEFKGPSVSPRSKDLEYLLELGLGIDRRMNEKRAKQKLPPLRPENVSFWFLANQVGKKFLRDCQNKVGLLKELGPGFWRFNLLGHPLFLVSRVELVVNPDSVPLHLLAQEPRETQLEVGKLLLNQPALLEQFLEWFATLHPQAWEELKTMARTKKKDLELNIRPLADYMGLEKVIEQLGVKKIINKVGLKGILQKYSLDELLANLSPSQQAELKKRLQ